MANEVIQKSKIEVRAEALLRLKGLMDSHLEVAQENLSFQLSTFLRNYRGSWGSFSPMHGEASPRSAIQENQHIQWAFPKVNGESLDLYLNPQAWERGAFGIDEPVPSKSEKIDIHTLSGFLIPGLAFDRQGTRLGRGWGYFDRALENFKGMRVGVTFEALVFQEPLPREEFDIPMDVLITERGIQFINLKGDRRND